MILFLACKMQNCVASNYSENTYLNIKNRFKHKRANSWTIKEFETLKILVSSGKKIKEIAAELGRSESAINKFLSRSGLRRREITQTNLNFETETNNYNKTSLKKFIEKTMLSEYNYLPDHEILEAMLFLVTKDKNIKSTAQTIINKFGTIDKILSCSEKELSKLGEIGESIFNSIVVINSIIKASLKRKINKRNIINCFNDVINYCKFNMRNLINEEFRIILLNEINEIIHDEVIQRGTTNSVIIAPREVIRKCIEKGANGLIVVHNHPSGDPTPSKSDIIITKMLAEAAGIFSISLLDHIVIGGDRHLSFKKLSII